MDTPRRLVLAGISLSALTVAGCMSPYPYQQYPSYPGGYYGTPQYGTPQYMPPGSSAPFPGNVELNAPTPVDPPSSGSSGGSSSTRDPYGDAPMFEPESKKVPPYTAPGDLSPPPKNTLNPNPSPNPMFEKDKNAFEGDQTPFGALEDVPKSRSVSYDDKREIPEQPPILKLSAEAPVEASSTMVNNAAGNSATTDEEFFTADFEQPFTKDGEELSAEPFAEDNAPNPFAHDAEGYRYLRGVVSYDDLSKTWSIIYDNKPARDDEYGGVFTLADDNRLAVLNDNDVVHVEGRISETDRDEFGKPKYAVEHLSKLVPEAAK